MVDMKKLRENRLAMVNGKEGVIYDLEVLSLRNWKWRRPCPLVINDIGYVCLTCMVSVGGGCNGY